MEYAQASSTKKKIKAWLNKYQADNVPEVKTPERKPNPPQKKEATMTNPARLINGTMSYTAPETTGTLMVGEDSNVMSSFAKCCNPM